MIHVPGKDCTSITVTNPDGVNKLLDPVILREKIAKWWDREAIKCDSYSLEAPMGRNCRRIAAEYRAAL